MRSGSILEYKSRGRGFESYSGHFHSHKLSRLIFQILLLFKFNGVAGIVKVLSQRPMIECIQNTLLPESTAHALATLIARPRSLNRVVLDSSVQMETDCCWSRFRPELISQRPQKLI